jgi:hypothetical protein
MNDGGNGLCRRGASCIDAKALIRKRKIATKAKTTAISAAIT